MRPIWSGSVSFGLVNIPVKLFLAAKSERFSFRMVHKPDQGPIQFKRFCSLEEKEVPYEEIGRAFEYEKGSFMMLEDEDFERIETSVAPHTVDIETFVDRTEVNPIFFDTPYYLEPARGGDKAYALLREALSRSGKIGIARVVLKEKEYVAAVHVSGKALAVSLLRYASEIRSPDELNLPATGTELPPKQLELALMLVGQLAGPFEPEKYRDETYERTEKMLREKLEGLPAPERPAPRATAAVVDLAEVLRKSIEEAKRPARAAGAETAEPRRTAKAAGAEEVSGSRRAPRELAARTTRRKKRDE
ncbi:MAG: Ku protein [Myxococcota bacterium]